MTTAESARTVRVLATGDQTFASNLSVVPEDPGHPDLTVEHNRARPVVNADTDRRQFTLVTRDPAAGTVEATGRLESAELFHVVHQTVVPDGRAHTCTWAVSEPGHRAGAAQAERRVLATLRAT